VYLHGRLAGALEPAATDAIDLRFTYDATYVGDASTHRLSVALPKRAEPFTGPPARNWFANVLPEGEARLAVAERVGVSERDDYGLLAVIGRDCAGAVSIVPAGEALPAQAGAPTTISPETLHAWLGERPRFLLAENVPARLSLAGAQNKLAVVVQDDGSLALPASGAPSTHIVKAPNPRFPALVSIEGLIMFVALRVGLPVPATRIVRCDPPCLLVDRFDRVVDPDDRTRATRIHQEDFCQALGIPPELKYQAQGGPSFAQCAELIRRLGLGGTALRDFVRWAVFNAIVGNADAHGKNIALLHQAGTSALAPFYDLTSTVCYPRSVLARAPAMSIGSARNLDELEDADWRDFAEQCDMKTSYVLGERDRMQAWILRVLDPSEADIEHNGGDVPALRRASIVLRARAEGRPTPDFEDEELASDGPARGPWGMSL
jgi:serine/threonine-protein kinase HipA